MDNRLFFPATQKNKISIGKVLSKIIPLEGAVLEIGSGSGEHGIEFQKRFPKIIWQTSDPLPEHRKSINSWIKHENLNLKMPKPIEINVMIRPWEIPSMVKESLKGIVSINMIHVAPWKCTQSLFEESSKLLNKGQFLILYGPFKIKNLHTSVSNDLFDKSLKIKNRNWGLRNLEEVTDEGVKNHFHREDIIEMPSNNFSIIYRRK